MTSPKTPRQKQAATVIQKIAARASKAAAVSQKKAEDIIEVAFSDPESRLVILDVIQKGKPGPAGRRIHAAKADDPPGYLMLPTTVTSTLSAHDIPTAPVVRAQPETIESLARRGFSRDEIHALVVPKRTLARRLANHELLSVEETDKAMRLERIASQAARVFGNADKANRWLRKPKRQLSGETPLAFLGSEAGARAVEHMLLRIEHGILA